MPLSRSSLSDSWRCDVDGGWTTMVWTLPSEAVSSRNWRASMIALPAALPPSTSKASIPPPLPLRYWRSARDRWGWLGRPG